MRCLKCHVEMDREDVGRRAVIAGDLTTEIVDDGISHYDCPCCGEQYRWTPGKGLTQYNPGGSPIE